MICPECNGRGESIYYIETQRNENSVTVEQRKGICRTCNGSGKKEQTNADRIRNMSDEELAAWAINEAPKIGFGYTSSETGLLKWLKQPAEEDD